MATLKRDNDHIHPRSIAQIRRDRDTDDSNGDVKGISSNMLVDHGTTDNLSCEVENFHPTSLESLCSPSQGNSEINLLCSWKAHGNGSEKILGQHHLRQLVVHPQYQSKGCPLTVSAKYKALIRHDFSVSPLVSFLFVISFGKIIFSHVQQLQARWYGDHY